MCGENQLDYLFHVSTSQALLRGWNNPCCLDQCLRSGLENERLQPLLLLFLYRHTFIHFPGWIISTPTLSYILFFSSFCHHSEDSFQSSWKGLHWTFTIITHIGIILWLGLQDRPDYSRWNTTEIRHSKTHTATHRHTACSTAYISQN